jgi:hypothetical protein
MSMTRKQKREHRAMQAEVERLRAELARRDSVLTSPPSTNANSITEDAMSPPTSLATGVDPDTETSESLLVEPRVLYIEIIRLAREYASEKWSDTEWMKVMDFRIQIIISTMHLSEEESTRRLIDVDWWSLGRNKLVAQHKKILLQERESLIQAKQALEDEETASRQTTQVTAPAHSAGQHATGRVQDESAIISVNYSCRDNSIVTQPIALGNTTMSTPRALGSTVVIPPAVPASNTSGSNNENNQDEVQDPDLETYNPNEPGIPLLKSPESQQSLNLAKTKTRNVKCTML